MTSGGRWVQNTTHHELWAFVSDSGGRVSDRFDSSLVPSGMRVQPGPFERLRGSVPAGPAPGTSALSGQASLMGDSAITGSVVYYNLSSGAYEAVPNAMVSVTIRNSYDNSVSGGFSVAADASGSFSMPCAGELQDYYGTVSLTSALGYLSVGPNGSTSFVYPQFSCNFAANFYMDSPSARVFVNGSIAIANSQAFFQRGRSMVPVSYTAGTTTAYYLADNDHIYIFSTSVWDAYGVFTIAHEYGHAFQEKALGGITAPGNCPSPHYLDGYYNQACALTEGFADYHAIVTRDTAATFANQIKNYSSSFLFHVNADGSTQEGAVAAFLYDLTDPAGDESFDAVQYPGSYLADLMHYCTVTTPLGPRRALGVDHLVYCLEQTVAPSVSNVYFLTRTPLLKASAENHAGLSPPGWNQGAIRTLWLMALYGQTSLAIPATCAASCGGGGLTLTTSLGGPGPVRPNQLCTWSVVASGGTAPYSYRWLVNGTDQANNDALLTMKSASSFTVQAVVTDAPGSSSAVQKQVAVSSSAPSCFQ